MSDMVFYITETIPFLKKGFLLCQEVGEGDVKVFDFIETVAQFLREEDHYTIDYLLHFIDMYPFFFLCGCSSIASQNLYENDAETKLLGQYRVYASIPLAKHILHTVQELNKLFAKIGDTGIFVKIGERRIQLTALDYFYLLIGCLYHDIAKSPATLSSMGYSEQDYRKSDHAFFSGQYLVSIRRDIEEHGVEIPENTFLKLYIPVVSHHQKPTDTTHAILLKYIDHKAREYESQKYGGVSPPLSETDPVDRLQKKIQIKNELDTLFEISDDLIHLLYKGLVLGELPKARRNSKMVWENGKKIRKETKQLTFVRFTPKIYVASYHVPFLLNHIAKNIVEVIPILEDKNRFLEIARFVIRKFRERGYIDDPKFKDDYLSGWWYKMKLRKGGDMLFFGFPMSPGEPVESDSAIVEVSPLAKQELDEYKNKGVLRHSLVIKHPVS
ncbi:hypothetical protein [Hydrogenivirga sp.]